jgi:hypothetical protein
VSVRCIDTIGCCDTSYPQEHTDGQARRCPRAGSPRAAARDSHARVRTAQAGVGAARVGPGAVVRLAVSLPQADAAGGLARRGRTGDPAGQAEPAKGRVQAHRRGQGALRDADVHGGAEGLGGRQLRRALRLLRPHRRRDPDTHPRRAPYPLGGAAGSFQRSRERVDAYTLELQRHGLESVEREVTWLDHLIDDERSRHAPTVHRHGRGSRRRTPTKNQASGRSRAAAETAEE